MAKTTKGKAVARQSSETPKVPAAPRSLRVFAEGIKSDADYVNAFSALMVDIIDGSLTPAAGNVVCKAGANMLHMIELKYKYGTQGDSSRKQKTLQLAPA